MPRLGSRRIRARLVVLASLAILAAVAVALAPRGRGAARLCVASFAPDARAATVTGLGSMRMSDWFATHPAHGLASTAAPSDSFLVLGTSFDENGDGTVTQVDTARIVAGQTVLWKWVTGSHTITSGVDDNDPNAGALFDVPSNTTARSFSYQFTTEGTYPFYCRFHWQLFNMVGVVIVTPPAAVPAGPFTGAEGFARPAAPNPTHAGTTLRFALAGGAHVRLGIFDLQGRRVASLIDTDLAAGAWSAAWDGLVHTGGPAAAGVYLARLEWAGHAQSQRITIVR